MRTMNGSIPETTGPEKKTRVKIPRQPMPEQDPRRRRYNFEEVPRGYSEEIAQLEASRCIQCKKPGCVEGCPVNIRIPAFIKLIAAGRFIDALIKLKEQTALPAVQPGLSAGEPVRGTLHSRQKG